MEVERVKKCSEEAALRASVLAFRKDNGSTESGLFHLHHREITKDRSNSRSPLTKTFIFLVLNAFLKTYGSILHS